MSSASSSAGLTMSSAPAAANNSSNSSNSYPYTSYDLPSTKFNPSMAIIIVVLVAALVFLGFFSIYVRRCAMAAGGQQQEDSMNSGAHNLRPPHAFSLRTKGLDKSVVESLPVVHFKDLKNLQDQQSKADHGGDGSSGNVDEAEAVEPHRECAVCLSEFEAEDSLRLLPKCNHIFHLECIDVWFQSHSTCPLCRATVVQAGQQAVQDAAATDRVEAPHQSVVIEEQEHEGDEAAAAAAREASFQSPARDFVVTIDRAAGDGGEESAREVVVEEEGAQPAALLARTRSGITASAAEGTASGLVGPSISQVDQRDSARLALFRNAHSFKKAAQGVVAHERAGMSPVVGPSSRLETRTSSKSWKRTPTSKSSPMVIEPMCHSTSLDSDGKYMKDFFSNNNNNQMMPKLVSQHSLPAAMKLAATNLPTTSKPGLRRAGSGLEFLRIGSSNSINSVAKAHLTRSQMLRSNSEHWVSIELEARPESLGGGGDGSSQAKPVQQQQQQQQLGMNESPRGETGRSERWNFLNLRNALFSQSSAS